MGRPGTQNPPPVLILRDVHKCYRLGAHEVQALSGVDLDLHPSELLALTGPSGSGKSTLLHIAGLIDRPDRGTLSLAGRNLFLSTDYSGLDPESSDQADSQVGRREYYTLPQLRSFSVSFRTNW